MKRVNNYLHKRGIDIEWAYATIAFIFYIAVDRILFDVTDIFIAVAMWFIIRKRKR